MSEAGIRRILVASLHQSIADLLPTRLEFYQNWLNPDGLLHGTIGLAPLYAVLSFLRQEGDAYTLITDRAGRYAAEWTMAGQHGPFGSAVRGLPLWLRRRIVLRQAARAIRSTYVGTRAVIRRRKGRCTVEVRGSLFCVVRDSWTEPLCGFYAATILRFLELNDVPARVRIERCRALGDTSCLIAVAPAPPADEDAGGGGRAR